VDVTLALSPAKRAMNVAERLGLPREAKIVVPHADDVGMSHGANGAFLELAGRGFITCGSVMVPCPWFLEAAGMAANRPELDLGVHLTLTSEWTHYRWRPLTGASKASGLVDDEGFMWRKAKDVCDHAEPEAVEAELRAQIDAALANGIEPSHLDCHMGTALAEPFTDIYLRLGRDYRIPVLFPRVWSNYGCGLRLPAPADDVQGARIAALEAIGLPIVDRFIETPWVPRAESDEAYDRLIDDIEHVDWPKPIKDMQRNWVGRSDGALVDFRCDEARKTNFQRTFDSTDWTEVPDPGVIRVFTTRPDTLFGATYMVLAPEHSLVDALTTDAQRVAVAAYREQAARKSDLDRTDLAKTKTGVFTGGHAVNPVNGAKVPIWIADYVLMGYGTGAIMAVPGHDERDFEFARTFNLPIVRVVAKTLEDAGKPLDEAEALEGIAVNSANPEIRLDGLPTLEAKSKITDWLAAKGLGQKAVNYKLRDWLFSRQRYWGEPFPVLLDANDKIQPIPEADLPVLLPDLADFKPTGRPEGPLSKAVEWVRYSETYRREINTMPQWAGSCWYYLRYIDPHNTERAWDPEKEKYWLPVDLYVGGAEHAVLHLLYSRFWHKVLFDHGLVSTQEPFQRLINQGMILGEDNQKMSKSRGNVINPDVVVRDYGADSLRLYEMFMGPLEAVKPWSMKGVEGVYRFLARAWRLVVDADADEVRIPPPGLLGVSDPSSAGLPAAGSLAMADTVIENEKPLKTVPNAGSGWNGASRFRKVAESAGETDGLSVPKGSGVSAGLLAKADSDLMPLNQLKAAKKTVEPAAVSTPKVRKVVQPETSLADTNGSAKSQVRNASRDPRQAPRVRLMPVQDLESSEGDENTARAWRGDKTR